MTIERDEFQAFLATQPQTLFLVADSCGCPLAAFLQSKGQPHAAVYSENYLSFDARDRASWLEMPLWAQHFVAQTDQQEGQFISGAEALELLEEI